ncbi:MAG: class I SAM-dependent methyltransferase [Pseudomonadota bacterium]
MRYEARLLTQLSKHWHSRQLPLRICFWDGHIADLGPQPCVQVRLKAPQAVRHFLSPNLDRLGCAYVEGEIDIEGPLPAVMSIAEQLSGDMPRRRSRTMLKYFIRRHTRQRDARAIQYHYDVSNDFYALWLDRNMVYSCAYFKTGEEDIHRAQEQKLDHICRKLRLRPGEQFLDIGCGWGGLIRWAAKHYGVKAVGVTLSRQQYAYAKARVEAEGLAGQVEVRLQDYRDIPGENAFDKVASVGMFEHVGLKNLPVYFHSIQRLLKEGGLVLNHGITTRDPTQQDGGPNTDSFIHQYVFPDGELPHVSRAALEMEQQHLEVQDVECLRPHYAQTLMHWVTRLEAQREQAIAMVGEKRYRIWRIYMAGCAHAFERGWVSIHQLLASKQTQPGLAPCPWTREYQYGSAPADGAQLAQPRWPDGSVAPRHREAIQPEQLAG